VTAHNALDAAAAAVRSELAAIDEACSRFRDDSELARLNRWDGTPFEMSPTLSRALSVALWAAKVTQGAVDPTCGAALRRLGYDRDFASLADGTQPSDEPLEPLPGWQLVHVDANERVIVPRGLELDLGATGKALACDRAAAAATAAAGGRGVLVSIGGDIATAGVSPPDGWSILVAEDHRAPLDDPDRETIAISGGGVATSTTTVRRWHQGGIARHHLLDPTTGLPARSPCRTVTVAASSCLHANVAATATIAKGPAGLGWLQATGLPARLIGVDGAVLTVGPWP
jgi:thiamine biosynthesis lipoprotein